MKKQINQLPSPSLPISMMISEAAYRVVVRIDRLIHGIAK